MSPAPLQPPRPGQPAVFRPFWEQFRSRRSKEPAETSARSPAGVDLADLLAGQRGLEASRSLVLDLLYDDFFRRCQQGEELDVASFCERFPSLKDSLSWAIWTHLAVDKLAAQADDHAAENWPLPGASLRGFFLDEVLGQGSFACVYLARDGTLGMRPVVVKLCRGDLTEAHTLGRLDHPNIVPVHSSLYDEETGLTAICMPYLGQATLANVLERAFVDGRPRRAAAILEAAQDPKQPGGSAAAGRLWQQGSYAEGVTELAAQIAEALAFVHAQGICHRDLKPSNILVTPAGRPIVLDFNLSATRPVNPTRVGGTLGYMAPEQLVAHSAADPERYPAPAPTTDIYAFGVLLYELLSGRHPFGPLDFRLPPAELAAKLHAQQQQGFQRLTWRGDGVDSWLARLIERCLAYEVADRTITAAELAAELRRGLSGPRHLRRWLLSRAGLRTATPLLGLALVAVSLGVWQALPVPSERQLLHARQAYGRGQYPEAVANLSRLTETDPRLAQAWFLRGRTYQKMGQLSEAIRDAQQAAALDPSGPMEASLGYCLTLAKRHRAAAEAYRAAIRGGFGTAAVYNNLGYTWMRLGQFEEAARCLDQAIALDPTLQRAYYNRALIGLTVQGQSFVPLQKCAADLDRAIHLGPTTGRLYYDAARANCLLIGHGAPYRGRALAYLQQAITGGIPPSRLNKEWTFRRLLTDPEFQALQHLHAQRPASAERVLVCDPIADLDL